MSNYNTSFDEEEDFFGHHHNFSALNSINMPVKTEEDIRKEEIMKVVHSYPFLFDGMYELLFKAAIAGEDLDKEYKKLKDCQHSYSSNRNTSFYHSIQF